MAWHQRLRNVFRGRRLQSDLERELSSHVRERVDELRDAGMSEAEAARAARLQLGNFTAHVERTRDMDINTLLESLLRNLRYAARTLVKTPAFTVTVIATLALGIGANSAVFSAINAVLLRPLPFPDGDRLIRLTQARARSSEPFVAPIRLEEWNRLNRTFQGITGYYSEDTSETSGDLPEKLKRTWVAPRFLQVLGVSPALGRDFAPEEEHFGGAAAVLISDRLWRRRFAAAPDAVGKSLRLPRAAFRIIGVMPANFRFPDRDVDLWSVSAPDAPFAQSRESTWYTAVARLKPGVTIEQARADLGSVQSGLAARFPKPDAQITPVLQPLKEAAVAGVRQSLWVLFGSVSLLLLIACTNIAALLLSRAAARRQETSVRFSLGASRASVAAQLLAEVLLLAISGAGLGLLVAAAASTVFRAFAKDLPRLDEIALDWRIVAYSLVCAIAVTLLCGIFPAIRSTRRDLAASLAHGGRSQVSGHNSGQWALVGVQVALAVTLLAGAGLLLRSFQELSRVSPGFDPRHILTFHISTTWGETSDFRAARERVNRILEALRAVPGVAEATTSLELPGVPAKYQVDLTTAEGRAETEPKIIAQGRGVTPEYFAVMRIPLVAGELCRKDPAVPAMMVNRTFADLYFNGTGVIGKHLVQPAYTADRPAVVRGIVGDARESGLDHEPPPAVYWCDGSSQPGTFFLVRTHGEPVTLSAAVRRKMREIEPQRSVYNLTPLTDHISDAYAENRLRTILLTFFAVTAIALASVGLYGTLSYLVNVRRREVALRLALGAMRNQVVRQFLTLGLKVSVLGCVAGLALAAASTRLLSGMLFGVSATDGLTLAGVVTLVLGVATAASLLPAVRAARVEPMQALREE